MHRRFFLVILEEHILQTGEYNQKMNDSTQENTRNRVRELSPMALILFGSWLLITMGWWLAAFYKIPPSAPEWLIRAQAVCFGQLPNGLPETYGWLSLIMTPLSMLAILFAVWGRELLNSLALLLSGGGGRMVLVLVVMFPLLEAFWVGNQVISRQEVSGLPQVLGSGPLPETYPRLKRPAPPFSLTNQRGENISNESLRGRMAVITFAFGQCETVCPTLVTRVLKGVEPLPPERRPRVIVISLDPWRDTVGGLATLAMKWNLGDRADLLSGGVEEINRVLDTYQVSRSRNLDNGDINHVALVYLLDEAGQIAYMFNNPSPRWITEAGRRILN